MAAEEIAFQELGAQVSYQEEEEVVHLEQKVKYQGVSLQNNNENINKLI